MMKRLPLFPLNTVLFPGMVLPLHIFEMRYRIMLAQCLAKEPVFGVVLIKEGVEVGGKAKPYEVGTVAMITEVAPYPDGRMDILTLGQERFRLLELDDSGPFLMGTVEIIEEPASSSERIPRLTEEVRHHLLEYWHGLRSLMGGEGLAPPLQFPEDPRRLAYLCSILLQVDHPEKQKLLEISPLDQLLSRCNTLLQRELAAMRVLTTDVQSSSLLH